MEDPGRDARMWAALCHVSAFAALIGVPFGHILGPLVVWLLKRADHPFVDDQGKEAVNFQISLTIYGLIAAALVVPAFVGGLVLPVAFSGLGLLVLAVIALAVVAIVFVILATIRANEGVWYRYPLTIRFLR